MLDLFEMEKTNVESAEGKLNRSVTESATASARAPTEVGPSGSSRLKAQVHSQKRCGGVSTTAPHLGHAEVEGLATVPCLEARLRVSHIGVVCTRGMFVLSA